MNDESRLIDETTCAHKIVMADGESLRLMRVGSVRLEVLARCEDDCDVEVYLVSRLAKNIVSYGELEGNRFVLM